MPYLCCELFLFEMKIGAKPILSTEVNFVAEKRDNFWENETYWNKSFIIGKK